MAIAQTPLILIVDDEFPVLKSFALFFQDIGYDVLEATNGREGIELFRQHRPDLVFTDLRMPEMDGLAFIEKLRTISPETPVVVISGTGIVEDAIRAVKLGAWDYITKPVYELAELEIIARRALETMELRDEVAALREKILAGDLVHEDAFREILTSDDAIFRVFQYIEAIGSSNQPVLITGQTGTGKELIARAVHQVSGNKGKFVALNAAGLDDQVFSDTLFGHVKGAFTGADQPREGMIAQAAGGTLFLDEIGDLMQVSQVKLLRLLQEQEYFPLGSDTPRKTDAKIVAATNRDLKQLVTAGTFRQDLYYRLCTHLVHLPPLAERKDDIPLLLDAFLEEAARTMNKNKPTVPPELYGYLATYDFPGNVRELKAMAYDAVASHMRGVLSMDSFLNAIGVKKTLPQTDGTSPAASPSSFSWECDRLPTLKEAEETLIQKALELAGGNQGIAARHLGITRQGLNKILNRKKLKP